MKGVLLIALLILAAGIAIFASGSSIQALFPIDNFPKRTSVAVAEPIYVISGIGYVEPESEVRKLSFKIDGVISRCPVVLGQFVKKGEPLIELRNMDEKAQVEVAEQQVALATAERSKLLSGTHPALIAVAERRIEQIREKLKYQERQFQRISKLAETRTATKDEFESSQTELEQSKINLSQAEQQLKHLREVVRPEERAVEEGKIHLAEAQLHLARERLANTILIAPFDGTVVEILKREGEPVRILDPEPALLFADLRKLRIRAEIDERFVSNLKTGQAVRVHGRSLGSSEYQGRISSLKSIMGKKTVFSRESSERKDLDVLQVFIEVPGDFRAPVGLEVDVKVQATEEKRPIAK